jgi:hypothetical protein
MIRIHTCEFTHTNSCVIDQSYDFVLTTWYSSYLSHFGKNVLLTSTWILGPAYTFVHCWLIMANLILPNKKRCVACAMGDGAYGVAGEDHSECLCAQTPGHMPVGG